MISPTWPGSLRPIKRPEMSRGMEQKICAVSQALHLHVSAALATKPAARRCSSRPARHHQRPARRQRGKGEECYVDKAITSASPSPTSSPYARPRRPWCRWLRPRQPPLFPVQSRPALEGQCRHEVMRVGHEGTNDRRGPGWAHNSTADSKGPINRLDQQARM